MEWKLGNELSNFTAIQQASNLAKPSKLIYINQKLRKSPQFYLVRLHSHPSRTASLRTPVCPCGCTTTSRVHSPGTKRQQAQQCKCYLETEITTVVIHPHRSCTFGATWSKRIKKILPVNSAALWDEKKWQNSGASCRVKRKLPISSFHEQVGFPYSSQLNSIDFSTHVAWVPGRIESWSLAYCHWEVTVLLKPFVWCFLQQTFLSTKTQSDTKLWS